MSSPFISSSFPSFLPFTQFTSSHNKCKPTYLDFASTNFFSSALPLPNDPCFCFSLFFLPSNVSYKFNITYSFMWLDFCTSLHKCCWTFVHNYRGKDEPNSSLSDKLLQQTLLTLLTSQRLSNKLI